MRLATLGIDSGGRGGPPLTALTGGGPTGPYVAGMPSLKLSPIRYAGMKRMMRPSRASITSRPSSPCRSITAMV